MSSSPINDANLDQMLEEEWLATNKIGGYASSSITGMNTRKYHGLLVAAMSPPVRRMVLLSKVEESVNCDGWPTALSCNEYPGTIFPKGHQSLTNFTQTPYPQWVYQGQGWTLLKELRLLKGENSVCLHYTLVGGEKELELQLRPLFALRGIHELMFQWNGALDAEKWVQVERRVHHGRRSDAIDDHNGRDWRIPATSRTPEVFFSHDGAFQNQGVWYFNTIYRCEESRGYSALEDLWNPGVITWKLKPGDSVHFVCSSDPIQFERVLTQTEKQYASAQRVAPSPDAETMDILQRSAEQFVLEIPDEPQNDIAVIGDYPWAAPSTRSALIGMNGLFLIPGKFAQGKLLINSLLSKMDRGVVPSELPENGAVALYKSADVSLWLIHAMNEYLRYTHDEKSQTSWIEKAIEILNHYQRGTLLGIKMDSDGLIGSHEPNLATTWMDAKVGEWVITPRAGKAVDINALWYNALRIVADWANHVGRDAEAQKLGTLSAAVHESFNREFWNDSAGCCFDAILGNNKDGSVRPNQLLAISLPYAVLDIQRHEVVLEVVARELLTPVGLRTLSPRDPNYQGHYRGNAVERDRAYHQGPVFAWLLGPFVTAYLRIHGRGVQARSEAKAFIEPCLKLVREKGRLCELFDGDSPHAPGGAIASALAIAEIYRALVEDISGNLTSAPVPSVRLPDGDPSHNRKVAH